jgi:hypothetical protein
MPMLLHLRYLVLCVLLTLSCRETPGVSDEAIRAANVFLVGRASADLAREGQGGLSIAQLVALAGQPELRLPVSGLRGFEKKHQGGLLESLSDTVRRAYDEAPRAPSSQVGRPPGWEECEVWLYYWKVPWTQEVALGALRRRYRAAGSHFFVIARDQVIAAGTIARRANYTRRHK